MANEGSTKPTELEDCKHSNWQNRRRADKAEAELLRVRGLLQRQLDEKRLRQILELERIKVAKGVQAIREAIHGRQWLSEEGRGPYSYDDERYQKEFGYALNEISAALQPLEAIAGDLSDCPTEWEEIQECWKLATPTLPQSSSPVPAGAEPADIGKHSCADELCDGYCDDPGCPKRKRVEMGKVNRVDEILSQANGDSVVTNEVVSIAVDTKVSAETGGEKAAPQSAREFYEKNYANCFDGVCISPEELFYFADTYAANFPRPSQSQTVSSGVEGAHEGISADKSVALAESSLSSPPHGILAEVYGLTAKSPTATIQERMDRIREICLKAERANTCQMCDRAKSICDQQGHRQGASPELLPTQLPKEK